jgi:hypothetical protein
MEKHARMIYGICFMMVFFFVCGVLSPIGTAQNNVLGKDNERMSLESPMKKMIHPSDEDFFDFAIIWGPFEQLGFKSLIDSLQVHNSKPWYNETINVIGHINYGQKWFYKKASWIECDFLHIGIIGQHWLFIIAIGNIAAW